MATFAFRFHPLYRLLAVPFGITPRTAAVDVADDRIEIRFGPWLLRTKVSNVVGCERSGPYSIPKTAGPAHLSLVDRGLTLATNPDAGLCLRFAEPVPAIEPFGRIRHPGVTVTVDRIDDLERVVTSDDGRELEERFLDVPVESPWSLLRRWARWAAGMALAAGRYTRSASAVARSSETRPGPAPNLFEPAEGPDIQAADDGVGATYERSYRVRIARTELTPEQLMTRVMTDLNRLSPREVAEFDGQPADTPLAPGVDFLVRMAAPWDAPVRVADRTPTSIRLATLRGHPEAGQVEFRSSWDDTQTSAAGGELLFEIHSLARCADLPFKVLYNRLHVAAEMQLYMWVHFCQRVAEVAGGEVNGKVEVHTIRYEG